MIPLAFLLASFAHRGSQAEGRLRWLTENHPTEAAWRDLLRRREFSPIEDPAWREKAYAEMPESSRLKASALISEDRYWVAIRTTGDWLFYRRGGNGKETPGGQVVKRALWDELGIGWEAVAHLENLDLPILQTESSEKRLKKTDWSDSRQMVY